MKNKYIGTSLDEFLTEEDILEDIEARAIKKVIAWQLTQEMETQGISKYAMAKRMHTSRTSLDRLLDPENQSVTLTTLQKAANVLGKQIRLHLV